VINFHSMLIHKLFSKKLYVLYSFTLILVTGCYEEVEIHSLEDDPYLSFNNIYAGIDMEKGWIILPVKNFTDDYFPVIHTNLLDLYIESVEYSEGNCFNLSGVSIQDSLCISFRTESGSNFNGYLYLTSLPVIQIYYRQEIPDEPKIHCDFVLSDNSGEEGNSLISTAGIELRGRSAMNRPKKSYGIELWNDDSGNDTRNECLLGMRNDDDWILDAMYIDKARMRNKISMEIWRDICTSSGNDKIHGKPYTESRFIELFVNLEYKGIYCLTERFDQKQLDLRQFDGSAHGLLYKVESWSNTIKFVSLADTSESEFWDGWEQKYPDPEELIIWRPLYDFTSFVINSGDAEFEQQISNYLDIDNLIDYFLFINLCTAFDNMGMNMIYARQNREAQFVIYPWDIDASWGRNWDSTFLFSEYWLSNKCYSRLFNGNVEGSVDRMKLRWNELRSELFTHANLMERFTEQSITLIESGAYRREKSCWPEMNLNFSQEIAYISGWLDQRIIYLDNKIQDAYTDN